MQIVSHFRAAPPDAPDHPGRDLCPHDAPERHPGLGVLAQGHVPGLDGLRAIAVILVFLFHARVPGFGAGFLGVDVFFVLSGFLITALLLAEVGRNGAIDLKGFFWRRLLRLLPALAAMLLIFVSLAPVFPDPIEDAPLQAALALTGLSDYGTALYGLTDELSHTWSLAVEAKFYLIFPLFLPAVLRRVGMANAWKAIAIAAIAATLWRVVNVPLFQGWNVIYYRFDTRLSGLLVGAALAAGLASPSSGQLYRLAAQLGFVPLLALGLVPMSWGNPVILTLGCTLVEVGTVVAILAVLGGQSRWVGLMAQPLLQVLGKLSYGFYLWHFPVIRWMRPDRDWLQILLIGFPLSMALAWVSHVTVERAAARYRRRGRGLGNAP